MSEEAPIRVMIVDDHELIRESLQFVLRDEAGMEVVASVGSAEEALDAARDKLPDVVIMDYMLPDSDGAAVTRTIKAERPETKVVMLTAAVSDDVLVSSIEAGCSGFVTKERAIEEVVSAVRAAHAGEALISPSMLQRVLPKLRRSPEGRSVYDLSPREQEVLALLAKGMKNQEIASSLGISLYTVRNHIQGILIKMQAHSKMEAVAIAVRQGLVEI